MSDLILKGAGAATFLVEMVDGWPKARTSSSVTLAEAQRLDR